jgi:hypothetical protein
MIGRYEEDRSTTGCVPNPGVEQLIDVEDELDEIMGDVALPLLSEQGRDELRGKRAADLADLMAETADGLRDCPQIQQAVQTSPEAFERVAAQDLAVGGLVQALQALYRRADNGALWSAVESRDLLDAAETQVDRAVRGGFLSEERRNFIEYRFSDAMSQRRQAQQQELEIVNAVSSDEERLARTKAEEAKAELVRAFVRKVLTAEPQKP